MSRAVIRSAEVKPVYRPRLRVYLGVDPGVCGGLAHVAGRSGGAVPMPATERDVWAWFAAHAAADGPEVPVFAAVEKVHAMPGNGVVSMFKFGRSFGLLLGCLTAAGIAFEEVTPQEWQGGLRVPRRKKSETDAQWKGRLRGLAQRLFPKTELKREAADALLIAEYARRKGEGLL